MNLKSKAKIKEKHILSYLYSIQNLLLFVFIFLFPSQLAYHFWPSWSYIFGIGIDYLAPTLYFTDLVLISLLLLWLIELVLKRKLSYRLNKLSLVCIFLFLSNFIFANNFLLALIQGFRILGIIIFALYLKEKANKINKQIIIPLSLSIIFFAILGIIQFILQRTVNGPFYFLGERSFSSASYGISLVNLFGREYLRVYSTFPHPNVLAGYLVVSGILIYGAEKLNIWLKNLSLLIGGVCLLLTFSKNAFIGLIFVLCFILIKDKDVNFKKLLQRVFLLSLVISFSFLFFIQLLLSRNNYPEFIITRLQLISISRKVIDHNLFFGAGLNNFIYTLPRSIEGMNVGLIAQPVHNIYLLLLSEIGIIFFTFLLMVAYKYFSVIGTKKNYWNVLAFIFIMMTGLFDHYWLTINQTRMLATLVIGLSLVEKKKN